VTGLEQVEFFEDLDKLRFREQDGVGSVERGFDGTEQFLVEHRIETE
jgi:hypothetical protein